MNDNKYIVPDFSNVKKFKYALGDFQGARLKYEKSEFKSYKRIHIDGFIIYNNSNYYIEFGVDNQLIRRLKLKSISNEIKNNSIEDKLLRLINLSKTIEDDMTSSWYSMSVNYYYNDYDIIDYNVNERREQKQYQKYQSKQISQKTNRMSKKGYKR